METQESSTDVNDESRDSFHALPSSTRDDGRVNVTSMPWIDETLSRRAEESTVVTVARTVGEIGLMSALNAGMLVLVVLMDKAIIDIPESTESTSRFINNLKNPASTPLFFMSISHFLFGIAVVVLRLTLRRNSAGTDRLKRVAVLRFCVLVVSVWGVLAVVFAVAPDVQLDLFFGFALALVLGNALVVAVFENRDMSVVRRIVHGCISGVIIGVIFINNYVMMWCIRAGEVINPKALGLLIKGMSLFLIRAGMISLISRYAFNFVYGGNRAKTTTTTQKKNKMKNPGENVTALRRYSKQVFQTVTPESQTSIDPEANVEAKTASGNRVIHIRSDQTNAYLSYTASLSSALAGLSIPQICNLMSTSAHDNIAFHLAILISAICDAFTPIAIASARLQSVVDALPKGLLVEGSVKRFIGDDQLDALPLSTPRPGDVVGDDEALTNQVSLVTMLVHDRIGYYVSIAHSTTVTIIFMAGDVTFDPRRSVSLNTSKVEWTLALTRGLTWICLQFLIDVIALSILFKRSGASVNTLRYALGIPTVMSARMAGVAIALSGGLTFVLYLRGILD